MGAKKEFVVFGLGRFGRSVAATLADSGCEVMVVDSDADKVHDLAETVTYAVTADVTDEEALEALGIRNFDGAIIGIGEDMEASIMVTILVKEMGIPYVLAKAQSDIHARVLRRVGADAVVFPEKETGMRIAHNLMMGNFFDAVELSSTFSMMELAVKEEWIGSSLRQLNLRAKYKINVVGVRTRDYLDANPDPGRPFEPEDVLIVIGKNEVLNRLAEMR